MYAALSRWRCNCIAGIVVLLLFIRRNLGDGAAVDYRAQTMPAASRQVASEEGGTMMSFASYRTLAPSNAYTQSTLSPATGYDSAPHYYAQSTLSPGQYDATLPQDPNRYTNVSPRYTPVRRQKLIQQ